MRYPDLRFNLQPIRPVARSGARYDRLPWYEVILGREGARSQADVDDYKQKVYASNEHYAFDLAVLDRACQQMRPNAHYSINVCVASVARGLFPVDVFRILGRHGVNPRHVVFELEGREWAEKGDIAGACQSIHQLRRGLHVAFAIDELHPYDDVNTCLPARYVKLSRAMTDALLAESKPPKAYREALRMCGPTAEVIAQDILTLEELEQLQRCSTRVHYWQGELEEGQPFPMPIIRVPEPTRSPELGVVA